MKRSIEAKRVKNGQKWSKMADFWLFLAFFGFFWPFLAFFSFIEFGPDLAGMRFLTFRLKIRVRDFGFSSAFFRKNGQK